MIFFVLGVHEPHLYYRSEESTLLQSAFSTTFTSQSTSFTSTCVVKHQLWRFWLSLYHQSRYSTLPLYKIKRLIVPPPQVFAVTVFGHSLQFTQPSRALFVPNRVTITSFLLRTGVPAGGSSLQDNARGRSVVFSAVLDVM